MMWVYALATIEFLIIAYIFKNFRLVSHRKARFTAMLFALIAHRDDKDKVGEEYKHHLDRVSRNVKGDSAKIVAWLHDIVEDGHMTHDDLEFTGVFTGEELFAIRALDKNNFRGLGRESISILKENNGRIKFISTIPLARQVKIADLKDNLDATRFLKAGVEITEKDKERFKKYESQLGYLEN